MTTIATADENHGLTVKPAPRALHVPPGPRIPAGSEPCDTAALLVSDLRDLRDIPLAQVAAAAQAGDAALEETLRRIAPQDGSRVLLVAASFNSAI